MESYLHRRIIVIKCIFYIIVSTFNLHNASVCITKLLHHIRVARQFSHWWNIFSFSSVTFSVVFLLHIFQCKCGLDKILISLYYNKVTPGLTLSNLNIAVSFKVVLLILIMSPSGVHKRNASNPFMVSYKMIWPFCSSISGGGDKYFLRALNAK